MWEHGAGDRADLSKPTGRGRRSCAFYANNEVTAYQALQWENDLSRYEESSVIATYTSTLEQLERSPPGTSDLLRILAFMDPESIPIEILKYGCSDCTNEDLETVRLLLQNTVTLQKAMQSIQRLSLATQQNDWKMATIRMHDLVQLVLRTKLMSSRDERKRWLGHAISIACRSFERIEDPRSPACWEDCERFLGQGQALQRHGDWYGLMDEGLLTMRSGLASYLWSRGRYKEAEELQIQVIKTRKTMLRAEHPIR
jgi:Tetratricopeptide repeat